MISSGGIIVPKLGSKASIELILETVHEGAIPRRLRRIISYAIVADYSALSIVKVTAATMPASSS